MSINTSLHLENGVVVTYGNADEHQRKRIPGEQITDDFRIERTSTNNPVRVPSPAPRFISRTPQPSEHSSTVYFSSLSVAVSPQLTQQCQQEQEMLYLSEGNICQSTL
jgi:hypothetical protein